MLGIAWTSANIGAAGRSVRRMVCVLAAATATVATSGCAHTVLGRPVIVGASVSCGVGASITPDDPLAVDVGVAYSAIVTAPHDVPVNLANAGTLFDPMAALREQVSEALRRRPSLVLALDALFWPIQQPIDGSVPAEEQRALRRAALEAALAELDRLPCIVVVGDIPDLRGAVAKMVGEDRALDDETLAAANARIAEWVSERPDRALVQISRIMELVRADQPIDLGGTRVDDAVAGELLQRDGLHATADGVTLLVVASLVELEHATLLESGAWDADRSVLAGRLESEARAAVGRARPGLGDSLSLAGAAERFDAAVKRGDDAAAAAALDSALARMASFDRNPLGDGNAMLSLGILFGHILTPSAKFPLTEQVWDRRWRMLEPFALSDRPDPWKLEMWFDLATTRDRAALKQAAQALAQRRALMEEWDSPRGAFVWSLMRGSIESAELSAALFPDFDEALRHAERDATPRMRVATNLADQGYSELVFTMAGDVYERAALIGTTLGVADAAQQVTRVAETAGHRRALRASELKRRLDAAREEALAVRAADARLRWRHTVYGDARSIEQEAAPGATESRDDFWRPLGPRVLIALPPGGMKVLHGSLANLGAGWLEDMNGAAAVLDGMLVATRAVDDAHAPLQSGEKSHFTTAAFWIDLQPSLAGSQVIDALASSSGGSVKDRAAIESLAHEAIAEHWPTETVFARSAEVFARGRVAAATVRIPAGIDASTRQPRWIECNISNAPITIMGLVAEDSDPPGLSTLPERTVGSEDHSRGRRKSRFHAIWQEGTTQFTGEIVEFNELELTEASIRLAIP